MIMTCLIARSLEHSRFKIPFVTLNHSRPDIGQAESLLDIGTRDIFSEEHDIFREHVRRFFTNEILPNQER